MKKTTAAKAHHHATPADCPSWCERPAGHDFESTARSHGTSIKLRPHVADLGDVGMLRRRASCQDSSDDPTSLYVQLIAVEEASSRGDHLIPAGMVTLCDDADELGHLTAQEARDLASLLNEAAAVLDR